MRTCDKPACTQEHEDFVSGNFYNGKILVLSATTSMRGPSWDSCSDNCCTISGFGDCANTTDSVENSGYRSILIGDSSGNVDEATGWGICTSGVNNAVFNWDGDACYASDERKNRIASFQNGLTVGLYVRIDKYYWDRESSSREINRYKNGEVFVQIFKI